MTEFLRKKFLFSFFAKYYLDFGLRLFIFSFIDFKEVTEINPNQA